MGYRICAFGLLAIMLMNCNFMSCVSDNTSMYPVDTTKLNIPNSIPIVEETSIEEPVIIEEETAAPSFVVPMSRDEILTYLDYFHQAERAASDSINQMLINENLYNHSDFLELQEDHIIAMQGYTFYEDLWEEWNQEYPIAAVVWRFLREQCGYSEAVAAGIIGNMMVECGGQTLVLQWDIYNASNHYGLCQWSSKYYPQMQGATLKEQLDFMKTSFIEVIDRFGKDYKRGFTHNDFKAMTNYKKVADAFCVIYERPGGSSKKRQNCAKIAYEYFTKEIDK